MRQMSRVIVNIYLLPLFHSLPIIIPTREHSETLNKLQHSSTSVCHNVRQKSTRKVCYKIARALRCLDTVQF